MKKINVFINMSMSVLALVSIYLSFAQIFGAINIQDSIILTSIDIFVWLIFSIEYYYKMFKSVKKFEYIKTNKLDFLSTIPVPVIALFYNNPLIYALRILRLVSFFDELFDNFKTFAKHKGVVYATYILLIVVTLSSFGIYALEKGTTVNTIGDAFWWAIVTVSTTGFGDIAPKTVGGRIVATILMFTGIAVFSVVMSTIGTMITEKKHEQELIQETIDLSGLTEEQKISVKNFVNFLKNS